jgi:hypothetical protein
MGLSGAGFGASKALEQIVAERLAAQQLEAAIAERQQRFGLDQERLGESRRQADVDAGQRQQTIDISERSRRDRNNERGMDLMKADKGEMDMEAAITGLPAHLKSLGGLIKAGAVGKLSPDDLAPPMAPRDPIADYEAKERISAKYRPAQRPERDPIADHEAKLKLDAKYKANTAGGVDPVKARETGVKMLETAKALRSDPNLGRLTGARIGNPDYALGVSQEPIAGSAAANVAPKFNTLKSLFTLDNIGLLKGVLSDTDMKILASAGSSLDTSMQDPAFVAELDQVIQKLENTFGGGQAAPVVDPRVQALIDKYKPK